MSHPRAHRALAVAAAVIVAAGASLTSAANAHPRATDGQLVFTRYDPALDDLVPITVNPDGSGERQVYAYPMECPQWSPDGTQLASCGVPSFVDRTTNGTTILNVDTGQVMYRPFLPGLFSLCSTWSPNGLRLACDASGIRTVRIKDWSAVRTVTTTDGEDVPGSYSPAGDRIVFARYTGDPEGGGAPLGLFVVNSDGSNLTRITPPGMLVSASGDWSPDGSEIVFSQHVTADNRSSIWMVHPDGTGLHRLDLTTTNTCGGPFANDDSVGCFSPVWSPSGNSLAFDQGSSAGTSVWIADLSTGQTHQVVDNAEGPLDWGTHPLQ